MRKTQKMRQVIFLLGMLLCTVCAGCGESTRVEEKGELVRTEAVGEIWQPLCAVRSYNFTGSLYVTEKK